jgi:hypothetical protein
MNMLSYNHDWEKLNENLDQLKLLRTDRLVDVKGGSHAG